MMASIGDPPIHCPKCGKVHGRGEYECDDSPLWPARCRGYLEGKRASDCLAAVRIAELRAFVGLVLEYCEKETPYWYGEDLKTRARKLLEEGD